MPRPYAASAFVGVCLVFLSAVEASAQGSTTRCYEMLGSVTCRTNEDIGTTSRTAGGLSVLAAVFQGMAEADERIRREKLEAEQRRLLDEQLRMMQAADAERLVLNAEAKSRREAQQRLYWSRATNVLVEAADSLDFDYEARRLLAERSQGLLVDLLTVNPQSSSQEILDNIRPVIGEIHRINRAFDGALIDWVQKNLNLLKSASQLEREKLEEEVAQAKKLVASEKSPKQVPEILSQRLDSAKEWILGNRRSCMAADSCYIEYLAPRMRRTVDSVRAVAEKRAAVAAREAERKRVATEKQEAAREAALLASRRIAVQRFKAALPRYAQYASLDSAAQRRFIIALNAQIEKVPLGDSLPTLALVKEAADALASAIDWCKGSVRCAQGLVPDSVYRAFVERRDARITQEEVAAKSLRCLSTPLSCSDDDILDVHKKDFLLKKTAVLHPEQFRVPYFFSRSIVRGDTAIEWSHKANNARIVVSRKSVESPLNAGRASKLITWNYILGGIRGAYYQSETIELLFDEESLALVEFKHAAFSRAGALRDQTPDFSCASVYREGAEWVSRGNTGSRSKVESKQPLSLPPAAFFVLAHLSWPASGNYDITWGSNVTVSVSNEYIFFPNVIPGSKNAELRLKNENGERAAVEGSFLLRPIGWAYDRLVSGAFKEQPSNREFDTWFLAESNSSCKWS